MTSPSALESCTATHSRQPPLFWLIQMHMTIMIELGVNLGDEILYVKRIPVVPVPMVVICVPTYLCYDGCDICTYRNC